MIDHDMAAANGSTIIDIVHNRTADHAAKRQALRNSPIAPALFEPTCQAVLQRQEWLTSLCHLIGTTLPHVEKDPDSDCDESNIAPSEQFPRLPWNEDVSLFTWTLLHDWPVNPVPESVLLDSDWTLFGQFVKTLKWRLAENCVVSHAELAFLCYHQGFKCTELLQDEHYTFQALIVWFKKCLKICRKHVRFEFFPGTNDSRLHNSWGKTMPAGAFVNARPFMSNAFLQFLVEISRHVVKANLDTWAFSVASFPC